MEPEDLPDAEDLWWSWVVLAALHRAVGNDACRFHAKELLLTLDSADGWLRMQRTHGSRSVLWGRSALAPDSPPDARRTAPDWALSDATEERRPTFLAWHAHGEWDSSALGVDEGAVHLLRPLLTVDPRIVALGREGRLTPDELAAYAHGEHLEEAAEIARLASATAPRTSRGSVWSRLRDQIHDQMRDTEDVDRELMQRPPILVQWSRANGPGVPFEYDVMAVRGRIIPSPAELTAAHPRGPLAHQRAADPAPGGGQRGVRAPGCSPGSPPTASWSASTAPSTAGRRWYQVRHSSQGPSLDDLAWEMAQRTPRLATAVGEPAASGVVGRPPRVVRR